MLFNLTHSDQSSSQYHAYFRKYRLFTNSGVDETALYGQIPILFVHNENDCKIFFGGHIGFKLSQIFSIDVTKGVKYKKDSIVFILLLLFSDNRTIGCQNWDYNF